MSFSDLAKKTKSVLWVSVLVMSVFMKGPSFPFVSEREKLCHRLHFFNPEKAYHEVGDLAVVKLEDVKEMGSTNNKYEGGLKSKFRFVITFLFFIVHT